MNKALIAMDKLGKIYDSGSGQTLEALRNISLHMDEGEFVAIMGPSGSGKSTLMNILGCLDTPSSGTYFLSGENVGELDSDRLAGLRNRVIGFVFQGFNLLSRVDVRDNVALPLLYQGVSRAESRARADVLLEKVGLSRHCDHLPNQLSGGQQQRVAIARALVTKPQLILADEPTGNLDTHTSEEIMAIFRELNENQGISVILVTHEPDIGAHAHRLIRIVDGNLAFDGNTADFFRSA